MLDGDPGVGKSTVSLDIAARTSTGSPMPDGSAGVKGAVLILSAEDGLADTIRPRLDAAGADPARVIAITEMTFATADGLQSRPVTIPGDLAAIEHIITEHDVRLVVIDVLMAYLSGDVNAHRDQDVRRALHILSGLAERTRCCVIVLRHLNKSGGGNAIYRGGGQHRHHRRRPRRVHVRPRPRRRNRQLGAVRQHQNEHRFRTARHRLPACP